MLSVRENDDMTLTALLIFYDHFVCLVEKKKEKNVVFSDIVRELGGSGV